MTISYTGDICSTRYWSFLRVIFRWRGSIWKSVLTELFIWLTLYYLIMAIYVTLLDEKSKNNFAHLAQYTGITADYIPLTFMLGFFVKIVVERWNNMFANIGFVDSVAHAVCSVVRGNDLKTVKTRRNIMRYLCLMQVLVLRDISVRVRKRFPTMQTLISAGLLKKHEQNLIEEIGHQYNEQFGIYWLPYNWICQLCYRLRENENIASDPLLSFVLRELREYRERLQTLINFDLVPIPLASLSSSSFYCMRTYFLICLFSRQKIETTTNNGEMFFPVMTVLQFIFYMGWTKVAEALLNPLGEDDDDFETLFVIERNIVISSLLADKCFNQIPEQSLEQEENNVHKHPSLINKNINENNNVLIGSAVRVMMTSERRAFNKWMESWKLFPRRRRQETKIEERVCEETMPLDLEK
uniref:Bestrophin homolog n=1 Tax=Meloidogyne enterolobii TaxID=390850 RepID=A0A6V7X1F3_MELEN|nr:unnamed protein product [Meloidogyne enterolobii]